MKHAILIVDNRQDVVDSFKSLDWGDHIEIQIAGTVEEAKISLQNNAVDLVYVGSRLDELSGFEVIRQIQALEGSDKSFFILLSDEPDCGTRIRQMNENIDDLIRVPFEPRELVARANILLSESQSDPVKAKKSVSGFSGKLAEMNLVDLLQSLELGAKSGVIHLQHGVLQGRVFLKTGRICDVELGLMTSEDALFSLVTWSEGSFRVEFSPVEGKDMLSLSPEDFDRRCRETLEEWRALQEQFPNWELVFETDDEANTETSDPKSQDLIPLIESGRNLGEILETSNINHVETLRLLKGMLDQGVIHEMKEPPDLQRPDSPGIGTTSTSDPSAQIMENFVEGLMQKKKPLEGI
jgi:CheY-like chemotaxis protein